MGKRRTNHNHNGPHPRRPKEDEASASGNAIHPGIARNQRVFLPLREHLVQSGVYRPSNRWRSTQGSGQQILQRAQNVAQRLPWLTKYNHARS